MQRRDRRLAAEDQAIHLGLAAQALGGDLVHADAGADFATRGKVGPGEQVAGLAAMDAADEGLGIVEAADKQHLLAVRPQRLEHLAHVHLGGFALGPPFPGVEAVAGEEARQADRRLGGAALGLVVAPDGERFQPGERHGDAEAAKEGAAGEGVGLGGGV